VVPVVPGTLLNGLAAYWNLDQVLGEDRYDSHINHIILGEQGGGVRQAPGKLGSAADFTYDGYDTWLECADQEVLRFVGDFTIALWVFFKNPTFAANSIYCKDGAFELSVSGDLGLRALVVMYDDFTEEIARLTSNQPIGQNVWTHLTIVKREEVLMLYRDGVLDKSCEVWARVADGGTTRIGASGGGYPFAGSIDEVGLWQRALSDAEVAALYAGGNGLAYENF
jgi:hypothetical protein